MTLYTYLIHFTTSLVTEMKDCDKPIDWESLKPNSLFRFNTPHGSQMINMAYVTSIEEIVRETDPRSPSDIDLALRRCNGDMKAAAQYLGVSDRTMYRKAKEYEKELNEKEKEI